MKMLLYSCKAKPYLYGMYSGFETRYGYHLTNNENVFNAHNVLNGKIIAECDFEVEEIKYEPLIIDSKIYYYYEPETMFENKFYEKSCLTNEQLKNYLGSNNGYAIHIKNLHIFDEPRELKYYFTENPYKDINKIFTDEIMVDGKWYRPVNKAPQNMMKVWEDLENPRVLISIRPEWLCKILNGEKTIEVRKKILKEMLK